MIKVEEMNLHGGIHTMEVMLTNPTNLKYKHDGIKDTSNPFVKIINLNRYSGRITTYIDSFSEFKKIFAECMEGFGAEEYTIRRVDFRIDDYFHTFDEIMKYHSALLHAMTIQNKLTTIERYAQTTLRNRTFNSDGQQIHCYDRIAKKDELHSVAKTRFEIKNGRLKLFSIKDVSLLGLYWADQVESSSAVFAEQQKQFADMVATKIKKEFSNRSAYRTPRYAEKFDEYRYLIFTAWQFRQICKKLGLGEHTCDVYAGAGRLGLNREWITNSGFEKYACKAAKALRDFFTL